MKKAVELAVTGSTNTNFPASYDSTKINLGPLMRQFTGSATADNFLSTVKLSIARPFDLGYPASSIHAVSWSSTIDWIFAGDNGSPAGIRRISLTEYNKLNNTYNTKGFITINYSSGAGYILSGLAATLDFYTTGTVAVTGTAVTGTSTLWVTDRVAAGARIGFGTTDPTLVTTWYEISAIGSDTSITLTTAIATTLGAGTPYVIEDLRIYTACQNTTASNCGLFVAKGLHKELFQVPTTSIAVATTIDNIRANYWLADTEPVTSVAPGGIFLEAKINSTTQYGYMVDVPATNIITVYKFNVRSALTLTAGKAVISPIITGTSNLAGGVTRNNIGVVATTSHGPGSGISSLYILSGTNIYRGPVSNVTAASTNYIVDTMNEVPPGGSNTFTPNQFFHTFCYNADIDRFIIVNHATPGGRGYLSKYLISSEQMDHFFLLDTKQIDSGSSDTQSVPAPSMTATFYSAFHLNGITHMVRSGNNGNLIGVPTTAHWTYAATTGNRIITPSIDTTGATKLYSVYINSAKILGSSEFGGLPEPFRVYARTSGISDNSGTWTLISDTGDLSNITATNAIQFMFEFRTVGMTSIPARIYGLTVIFELSDSLPPAFKWSITDSSANTDTMGFVQILPLGSIPTFIISYYRSDTNALVLSQASTGTTNGSFQYYNGSTWVSGTGTDTVGLRRRFVPSTPLSSGVTTYIKLTTS